MTANEASDGVSLREQITGLILDIPNAYKLADAIMSLIHQHDQRIVAEARIDEHRILDELADQTANVDPDKAMDDYGDAKERRLKQLKAALTAQQDGQGEQK